MAINITSTLRGALAGVGVNTIANVAVPSLIPLTPTTMVGSAVGGGILDNVVSFIVNKPKPVTAGERIMGGLKTTAEVVTTAAAVVTAAGTLVTITAQGIQLFRAIRAGNEIQSQPADERAAG